MRDLHDASALGHADDFADIINELCVSADDEPAHRAHLLERKAASPAQRFRRPGTAPAGGDTQRDAIVAIGKAVIDQGKKIDAFIAKHSLTPGGARDLRLKTFETFKSVNDRRIKDLKTRGRSDGLDEAQLERINKALDRIADVDRRLALAEVKRNRPQGMGNRTLNGVQTQSTKKLAEARLRKAVVHYMRTGQEMFEGEHLSVIQKKTLHSELNPDGGYLVLPERGNSPLRTFLTELSMMRQRARCMEITTPSCSSRSALAAPMPAGWPSAERGPRPAADAGRRQVPDHGALRRARCDADAARRRGDRHRGVAGRGDRRGV